MNFERTFTDASLLDFMFDPSQEPVDVPATTKSSETQSQETKDWGISSIKQVQDLELKAITFAEQGELPQALEVFTEIVTQYPSYAPAYNNRANALQLSGRKPLISDIPLISSPISHFRHTHLYLRILCSRSLPFISYMFNEYMLYYNMFVYI